MSKIDRRKSNCDWRSFLSNTKRCRHRVTFDRTAICVRELSDIDKRWSNLRPFDILTKYKVAFCRDRKPSLEVVCSRPIVWKSIEPCRKTSIWPFRWKHIPTLWTETNKIIRVTILVDRRKCFSTIRNLWRTETKFRSNCSSKDPNRRSTRRLTWSSFRLDKVTENAIDRFVQCANFSELCSAERFRIEILARNSTSNFEFRCFSPKKNTKTSVERRFCLWSSNERRDRRDFDSARMKTSIKCVHQSHNWYNRWWTKENSAVRVKTSKRKDWPCKDFRPSVLRKPFFCHPSPAWLLVPCEVENKCVSSSSAKRKIPLSWREAKRKNEHHSHVFIALPCRTDTSDVSDGWYRSNQNRALFMSGSEYAAWSDHSWSLFHIGDRSDQIIWWDTDRSILFNHFARDSSSNSIVESSVNIDGTSPIGKWLSESLSTGCFLST